MTVEIIDPRPVSRAIFERGPCPGTQVACVPQQLGRLSPLSPTLRLDTAGTGPFAALRWGASRVGKLRRKQPLLPRRSASNSSRNMRAAVAAQSTAHSTPSIACISAICVAEILDLAGYSIVPALLPQIMEAWRLDGTQAGWLAGSISAGYMLGVIPLVAATDRMPARIVYLASALVGVISSFGVAFSDTFAPALLFRALSGIGLAGMYMPGLRALTDGMDGPRQARVAAFYTSSFTIGTVLSFVLGYAGVAWGWRAAFIVAAIAGVAGLMIAWAMLPRSPAELSPAKPLFPLRAVLNNGDAVVLTIAYTATIWGALGLRQWIVVFLDFCAGQPTRTGWAMLTVPALINLLGVPAGLWGNELSIRFGLRSTAIFVFVASAIVIGFFGLAALLPFLLTALVALAVGFIVQGNFSNLSSGLLAVAVPQYAGATMALFSCIGFGGGFLGTVLFGSALDHFGGPSQLGGWVAGFGTSGVACLVGAAATAFYRASRTT
jgi:predicted MFS family arabinose efflux permease